MKVVKLSHLMMIVMIVFLVGFLLGAKTPEPKWVGYLVFGKAAPKSIDPGMLIPPPDSFLSRVDSDIVIGLREDGVVVWKQRETKTDNNGK